MKRFFYISVTILLFLQACSTDFDLTSTWKDIPVIYGMLDKDSTTFIKINKAFLDPKTDALSLAQNPDSLYYKNLTVQLNEYDGSTATDSFLLTKVDGNLIGHVKQGGVFANAPNYLYMTTHPINSLRTYKLVITNNDNGKVISAVTSVIGDFTITIPFVLRPVDFFPGSNSTVSWVTPRNGKVYGLTVRFHYHEINKNTSERKDTILDWKLFQSTTSKSTAGNETMNLSIQGGDFYNFVSGRIPDNPNVYRVADSLDYIFSVGGESYYTYTQVSAAHGGLTSGQIEPEYTNIENGRGLFSSRTFKVLKGISLKPSSIDSLACGHITKHLGFINAKGETCP